MTIPTCPKCGGHSFTITCLASVDVEYHDNGKRTFLGATADFNPASSDSAGCTNGDCEYDGPLGSMVGKEGAVRAFAITKYAERSDDNVEIANNAAVEPSGWGGYWVTAQVYVSEDDLT